MFKDSTGLKLWTVMFDYDGRCFWKNVAAHTAAQAEQDFLDWVDGRCNVQVVDVDLATAIDHTDLLSCEIR